MIAVVANRDRNRHHHQRKQRFRNALRGFHGYVHVTSRGWVRRHQAIAAVHKTPANRRGVVSGIVIHDDQFRPAAGFFDHGRVAFQGPPQYLGTIASTDNDANVEFILHVIISNVIT